MCPVSEKFLDYAKRVYLRFHKEGLRVDMDESNITLNKKIRNAQLEGYNYIFVVGDQEVELKAVDVRTRDNKRLGKIKVSAMARYLSLEKKVPSSMAYNEFYEDSFYDPEVRRRSDRKSKRSIRSRPSSTTQTMSSKK